MSRYFVVLYLDSFSTTTSGDMSGQGEFYFKCKGHRYPNDGHVKLGENETFDPEPNLVFYSALTENKEVEVDIQVMESDRLRDDKFIDYKNKFPVRATNETLVIKDKKGKCTLKVILRIEEARNW